MTDCDGLADRWKRTEEKSYTFRGDFKNLPNRDFSEADDKSKNSCVKLKNNRCHFISIHYNFTSKSRNQTESRAVLREWDALKAVPSCWRVLEGFICQIYYPKCDNGTERLPCRSYCLRSRDACSMIPNFNKGKWPDELGNCDKYPTSKCDETTTLKSTYNHTESCYYPLTKTVYKKNWYDGIKGCGLKCQNQLFTLKEHQQSHLIIAILGTTSMLCNLFCVATFAIDWKAQSKYPAKIIFYMNFCFLMSSLGWLLQFLGDTHNKIVCRSDGTPRSGEPGSQSGYGWCLVSFLLVYCFSFSGTLWFVMLSYAWHSSFRTLGSTKDKLVGKTAYFHVLSWMIPASCTIAILILEEVDGSSVAGICFVGYKNSVMRHVFLLFPFGACLLIGGGFLIRGTVILYKVKEQNMTFLNGKASTKIRETIVRIVLFSSMAFGFIVVVLACHIYESRNKDFWKESLNDFIRCEASLAFSSDAVDKKCTLKHKPGINIVLIQVVSNFGAGIIMSSWIWTKVTLKTWKKAWIRFRGFDVRKKIQISLNRKRVRPIIANIPQAAVVVPGVSKAMKHRGSVISNAPSKQSSKLRLTSFITGIADEIRSKLGITENGRTSKDFQFEPSPLVIRPREGRRATLLSIESLLTASNDGKLCLRRGSMPTSLTSGSEYGMAFGHMWSINPQLNRPSRILSNNKTANLRVIRLGEDIAKQLPQETRGKTEGSASSVPRKSHKRRRRNKIEPTRDNITHSLTYASQSSLGQSVDLPPLKNELRQRSPLRTDAATCRPFTIPIHQTNIDKKSKK
eukprot:gene11959-13196_t